MIDVFSLARVNKYLSTITGKYRRYVQWKSRFKRSPCKYDAIVACDEMDRGLISMYIVSQYITPQKVMEHFTKRGCLFQSKWIFSAYPDVIDMQRVIDIASQDGYLDICKWVRSVTCVCLTSSLYYAASRGWLNVVVWCVGQKASSIEIAYAISGRHPDVRVYLRGELDKGAIKIPHACHFSGIVKTP